MNEGKRGFCRVICLFFMFSRSLNSLVQSWNVKISSFSNGKLICYKNCLLTIFVLYGFGGHFEL